MKDRKERFRGFIPLPIRLLVALGWLGFCSSFSQVVAEEVRPNIILLFIDDLGIGDVSSFAADDLETPNIDSLAETGVRFTNGYAPFSICSPSRASTMTGLYSQRFSVYGNDDRGMPLPEGHPGIAQTLKDAGYVTGMVGRWDLGDSAQGPFDIGFQEVAKRRRPVPLAERDPAVRPSWADVPVGVTYLGRDGSYWTEINGPELVEFVDRHKERPFYIYYAPLAVHFPVEEVPQKYLDRAQSAVEGQRRYMAGTILALDDTIGQLLDKLKTEGLYDNTLIFLVGDNGGSLRDGSLNGPLRGGKQTQWDGGYRVPYIVSWPAKFEGGRTLDGLVSSLDVYPTAAAAAGTPSPSSLDGRDLLPYLAGETNGSPNEALYFRWHDSRAPRWNVKAIRQGPWRLVTYSREAWDNPSIRSDRYVTELYNLEADPGETRDLATRHPDRVEALQTLYETWERKLPPIDFDKTPGSGSDQAPMPYGAGPDDIGWTRSDGSDDK